MNSNDRGSSLDIDLNVEFTHPIIEIEGVQSKEARANMFDLNMDPPKEFEIDLNVIPNSSEMSSSKILIDLNKEPNDEDTVIHIGLSLAENTCDQNKDESSVEIICDRNNKESSVENICDRNKKESSIENIYDQNKKESHEKRRRKINKPPSHRIRVSSDAKNDMAATSSGGSMVAASQTGETKYAFQQDMNFAIKEAQEYGGNFKAFETPYGNFVVPVLPTPEELLAE